MKKKIIIVMPLLFALGIPAYGIFQVIGTDYAKFHAGTFNDTTYYSNLTGDDFFDNQDGSLSTLEWNGDSVATYGINFNTLGTYYLYMNVVAPSIDADSVSIADGGFNDTPIGGGNEAWTLFGPISSGGWVILNNISGQNVETGVYSLAEPQVPIPDFTITSTGVIEFRVRSREAQTQVNGFVFSMNPILSSSQLDNLSFSPIPEPKLTSKLLPAVCLFLLVACRCLRRNQ